MRNGARQTPHSVASATELASFGAARGASGATIGVFFGRRDFGFEEFEVGFGDVAAEDRDEDFLNVAFGGGVADPHCFGPHAVGAQLLGKPKFGHWFAV